MDAIVYYLSLPLIYLLSLTPFPILYFISDGLYIILYHLIGYRRKVVFNNLKKSFPEKPDSEIIDLQKKFYHYFCDFTLETFKTLTISRENMIRHCSLDPAAEKLFKEMAAADQSLIIVMGHHGNWEWAGNTFSICCKHQLYVIYHPLANKHFDGLIRKMRQRFGTKLIPMNDTFREMIKNRSELNATAFIADQAPSPEKAHWMTFMNQATPVFLGAEKIAQKIKYPMVYVFVKKLARGRYTLMAEVLLSPPYNIEEGIITEAHTRKLESDIIAYPETWLWTHKRWKHKRF